MRWRTLRKFNCGGAPAAAGGGAEKGAWGVLIKSAPGITLKVVRLGYEDEE
jgi:hypothetical protein